MGDYTSVVFVILAFSCVFGSLVWLGTRHDTFK